ncbi:MAG: ABC transporter permease, partial [Anaerolineaceae bacterium]|nr:ABC transporter permease [Anaerolineaceae bacterium]
MINKTKAQAGFSTRFLEQSLPVIIPAMAIVLAFLVSGIVIFVWGSSPIEAYKSLFAGAFGSPSSWAATLVRLSPLVFTGLAVTYGYRSGFFNIGAEGQLYMGALAATWVGITFVNLPGILLIPLMILAAALMGSVMAFLPGILKAWKGFNEVLTTLLMNYILLQYFEWVIRIDHPTAGVDQVWSWVNWLGVKDPTQPFPKSAFIAEQGFLPSIGTMLNSKLFVNLFGEATWYQNMIGVSAFNRITLAPILAILFAVLIYFVLFKTTTGYQARAVGVNPDAARYMGVNIKRTILTTALISGALAGMGGAIEILGAQHRVIEKFLVDAGFTGIPVALIGNLHPYGVLLSALFFGALRAGANRMQIIAQVPIAVVQLIQSLAIL